MEASYAKLERAAHLDSRLFAEVARVYVDQVGRPDLALRIAGQNVGWLSQVAGILVQSEGHRALAEEIRVKVTELLKAGCREPDASAGALASLAGIYRSEGDKEKAIELYCRALAKEYGQVQWRFALATLLAEAGRIHEAIQEAKTCLRLRPGFTAAQKLVEDLSILPEAIAGDNPMQTNQSR